MKTLLKYSGLAAGARWRLRRRMPRAAPQDAGEAAAPIVDKGDVAWMMTSSLLVLFMIIPGLALFYGGLVRTKNMLSVLMQCTADHRARHGDLGRLRLFLRLRRRHGTYWGGTSQAVPGRVTSTRWPPPSRRTYKLPEYVFIAFQMTFAAITPALIVGAFAERIKFSAVLLFVVLWVTFVYFPIAHMVWGAGGLMLRLGRDRLCRRHRGAYQRRDRGAGGRPDLSARGSASARTTWRRIR